MDESTEAKPKKSGWFSLLRESMKKSSEGCGPGCGCHAAEEKKKTTGNEGGKKR